MAAKPATIEAPEQLLGKERLETLSLTNGLAIGEIAGRDSIAAVIKACQDYGVRHVLPTAVYTGTQYGDWDVNVRNVEWLKARIGATYSVDDLVFMGNPELWAALNGRYASAIAQRFGMCSPCLACHLYMHLCRVPLSLALNRAPIISGERDSHQRSIKLSQTPLSINAMRDVLAYAGIKLLLPIRELHDNKDIEAIVGSEWQQGQRQVECVMSGNYKGLDKDMAAYDEAQHKRYIDEFLIPAGKAIIDAWMENRVGAEANPQRIDYMRVVRSVLE